MVTNALRDEQVAISFNGGKDCKCILYRARCLGLIERKKARCSCTCWWLRDSGDIEEAQMKKRNAVLMESMAMCMYKAANQQPSPL